MNWRRGGPKTRVLNRLPGDPKVVPLAPLLNVVLAWNGRTMISPDK